MKHDNLLVPRKIGGFQGLPNNGLTLANAPTLVNRLYHKPGGQVSTEFNFLG